MTIQVRERRLSQQAKLGISKGLGGTRGTVVIVFATGVGDAAPLMADLAEAFQTAGWEANCGQSFGRPSCGFRLEPHSPIGEIASRVIQQAGISAEIHYREFKLADLTITIGMERAP